MKYDIVDLKLLVAISDTQNVSAGAAMCYLSPSSASLRLRNLEEVVGTLLFERHARGVRVTTAGMVTVEYARECLRVLDRMHADLAGYASGHKVELKIFACTSAMSFLTEDLQSFLHSNPGVRIILEDHHGSEIAAAVAAQKADLGIAVHDSCHPELEFFDYRTAELVAVVSRSFTAIGPAPVSFATCLDFPMVSLSANSPMQRYMTDLASSLGRRTDSRVQVSNYPTLLKLVQAGVGVGIAPRSLVDTEPSLDVRVMPLTDAWARRNLRICLRRERPNGARVLSELCLHLVESAARHRAAM